MNNNLLRIRLIIFSILSARKSALIPEICVTNVTTSKICCPTIQSYGTSCGSPIRGICRLVTYTNEFIPSMLRVDDRVDWPSRFFTHLCHCSGNYFGIACEHCRVGWIGNDCDRRQILVRRNILSLNSNDRAILNYVIKESLNTYSGYVIPIEMDNRFSDPILNPIWIKASLQYKKVFDHRFASRNTLFTNPNDCTNYGRLMEFNHNGVGLLTWHRYMMLDWEKKLQRIALERFGIQDFTIPYWDWVDLQQCDICTEDLIGEEGEVDNYGTRISRRSQYYNWTEFCMEPQSETSCYGCHKSERIGRITRSWNNLDFPTLEDVSYALGQTQFFSEVLDICDSFHKAAEGVCGRGESPRLLFMHNKIHNMIDGSMCCSSTSVNDPLFIFHHVQIDRIFQAWYQRHQPSLEDYPLQGEFPGHGRNSYLVGFLPLVTHADLFTNSANLGYVYDNYDFSSNRNRVSKK